MEQSQMVDQIDEALVAHQVWKEKLLAAIDSGAAAVKPDEVAKDNLCQFGKWLYGNDIPVSEKERDDFMKVKVWHAAFHREAGYVVDLVVQGKIAEAKEAMTAEGRRYFQVSAILQELLARWKDKVVNSARR